MGRGVWYAHCLPAPVVAKILPRDSLNVLPHGMQSNIAKPIRNCRKLLEKRKKNTN